MRVAIDNRVRVSGATDEERAALTALCEHPNPRREGLAALEAELEKRRFDKRLFGQVMRAREEPRVLRTWRDELWSPLPGCGPSAALALPRGAWSRPPLGGRSAVEDCRTHGHAELRTAVSARWLVPKKTPRDYQEAALAAMLREEQGLLRQAAGSGKTNVLLTFASRARLPTLAVVPTQALLEQWVGVAIADFRLRPEDIGAIGGGSKSVRPLTVATVDALAHDGCKLARELSRTFGVLLFDEVYGAAARTRFDVVDCSAARYRFGAGDDERRKDDLECLTYDAFGDVIASASRKDLEKAGWILPVRVRLVETGVEPPAWWSRLEPAARARRHTELLRHLEEDLHRATLCAALVLRAAREGQVLAFTHHVDHAYRLHADSLAISDHGQFDAADRTRSPLLDRTGYFLGGSKMARERQETTVRLLEGGCRAAFATYKALGKGVNLPAVDRAVLATPIHGSREDVSQVLARLNRTSEGKCRPEAVVLYDERVFGLAPVRAFLRGGREVVVERAGGGIIDARDYIDEREEKSRGASAGSFFRSLG